MTGAASANDTGKCSAQVSQRIDQWLWRARFFKTRTLASKFVNDGNVRLTRNDNTTRIDKSSANIRAGDTLVFTRNDRLRIIVILECASRRGPASEAQALYDDKSPPPPTKPARPVAPFEREKGAGRPTKKDRRALTALKTRD
ncbi:RNA-binding S4 domain-containing protein [Hyphococcus flavus]|uniref:RNA-binding S4 domain-containing protein n=1 Tax=Hyphococcus flavus TaxID=1866326 RepID=A0AAE9ZJE9_9PROT|nr:RNA-binding S4 domain-containing protein [Hyphococcus flavus]WDI31635.1 RNA-binding S4 domain-containing protein [Hyphococcus flavus]